MGKAERPPAVDLERYRGHTPGPWGFADDYVYSTILTGTGADESSIVEIISLDWSGCYYPGENPTLDITEEDKQLIVDAPLILADLEATRRERDAAYDRIVEYGRALKTAQVELKVLRRRLGDG